MILLDTHTLLWMDRDDPALGPRSRDLIQAAWRDGNVSVCAISFWEAAMLLLRGRIQLSIPIEIWRYDLLQAGVREIPLDGEILLLATQLADLHRDPADRFIIAAALCLDATLVTADGKILQWSSPLPRMDARA
jgi:PIN domain nuclease of toxin-antitoxin system